MKAKNVWAVILIVISLFVLLWGIGNLYFTFNTPAISAFGGSIPAPSKVPGFIGLSVGIVGAFFGTKLIQKK